MESSTSDVEMHQHIQSPPRRRRSTFFERRDSIVPQTNKQNLCNTDSEIDAKHKLKLLRYHEQLLIEKEQWRKELKNRKHKYNELKQQFQLTTKVPRRSLISYAALTKKDIQYINAKPNLLKLAENQNNFHLAMKETVALYRRVNELDNDALSQTENIINKINKHILENSSIELQE